VSEGQGHETVDFRNHGVKISRLEEVDIGLFELFPILRYINVFIIIIIILPVRESWCETCGLACTSSLCGIGCEYTASPGRHPMMKCACPNNSAFQNYVSLWSSAFGAFPEDLPPKQPFWDRPGVLADRALVESQMNSPLQQASFLAASSSPHTVVTGFLPYR